MTEDDFDERIERLQNNLKRLEERSDKRTVKVSNDDEKYYEGKITVKIKKEIYEILKSRAAAKRYNTKQYTDELIGYMLDLDEFAEKFHIDIDEVRGNMATIIDRDNKRLVDVSLDTKNGEFHCEVDTDNPNCKHIKFLRVSPQMDQLLEDKKE